MSITCYIRHQMISAILWCLWYDNTMEYILFKIQIVSNDICHYKGDIEVRILVKISLTKSIKVNHKFYKIHKSIIFYCHILWCKTIIVWYS